jgi:hypothetical protein
MDTGWEVNITVCGLVQMATGQHGRENRFANSFGLVLPCPWCIVIRPSLEHCLVFPVHSVTSQLRMQLI